MLQSAIYTGWVGHRRFSPVPHAFKYRIYMMYLDLDELPQLFKGKWFWSATSPTLAWFKRSDYLGNNENALKSEVASLVKEKTGKVVSGPIRLLTHMRYFGYCFNPVSFYYCFKADGTTLQSIVTEITNTPWRQRHAYVLDCESNTTESGIQKFNFRKDFHVSPFIPMNIQYDWALSNPDEQLNIHMRNLQAGIKVFDATMALVKKPITSVNLAKVLVLYPLVTMRVISAIYWQAMILWVKRAPFFPNPRQVNGQANESNKH